MTTILMKPSVRWSRLTRNTTNRSLRTFNFRCSTMNFLHRKLRLSGLLGLTPFLLPCQLRQWLLCTLTSLSTLMIGTRSGPMTSLLIINFDFWLKFEVGHPRIQSNLNARTDRRSDRDECRGFPCWELDFLIPSKDIQDRRRMSWFREIWVTISRSLKSGLSLI